MCDNTAYPGDDAFELEGFIVLDEAQMHALDAGDYLHADGSVCDCQGECIDWLEDNYPYWALPLPLDYM